MSRSGKSRSLHLAGLNSYEALHGHANGEAPVTRRSPGQPGTCIAGLPPEAAAGFRGGAGEVGSVRRSISGVRAGQAHEMGEPPAERQRWVRVLERLGVSIDGWLRARSASRHHSPNGQRRPSWWRPSTAAKQMLLQPVLASRQRQERRNRSSTALRPLHRSPGSSADRATAS
jgi:hypothetical protein